MARLARLALKFLAVTALLLAVVAGAGWTYVMAAYPRVARPRALVVAGTPEQIARGRYLSEHVVGCTDCHGERDWTRYSAPQMPSRAGHDAWNIARVAPSAMIFIPCRDGISHNEAEFAELDHIVAAANVLLGVVIERARVA